MSNHVETILDSLVGIYGATDEILNEWNGEGNLQFPTLFGMMAIKMGWGDKEVREADPIIRYYIRRHPEWHVTRGAHGGIMRISDKQKKEEAKSAKNSVKKQLQIALEAKVQAMMNKPVLSKIIEEINDSDDNDLFSDR
jgi:hypothetical protein